MEQGHALLALIAIPILSALLLVFVPSEKRDVVRIVAVLASLAMFALSVYVFVAYETSDTQQFDFFIRYNWIGGNGLTVSVGLEEENWNTDYVPNVVAKVGITQDWGSVTLFAAYDDDDDDLSDDEMESPEELD